MDFSCASQGEAVQFLVASKVAKHRLYRSEASPDHLVSLLGVDLALHALACLLLGLCVFAHEDGHLPELASLRWRRHWVRSGHFSQSRCVPLNRMACRPAMLQFVPLRYSR